MNHSKTKIGLLILASVSLISCVEPTDTVIPAPSSTNTTTQQPPIVPSTPSNNATPDIAIKFKALNCQKNPKGDNVIYNNKNSNQPSDYICKGARVMYGADRNVIPTDELRPFVYGYTGTMISTNQVDFDLETDDISKNMDMTVPQYFQPSQLGVAYECIQTKPGTGYFKACQKDKVIINYESSWYKSHDISNFLYTQELELMKENGKTGQIMEVFSNGHARVYLYHSEQTISIPLNKLKLIKRDGINFDFNFNFDCDQANFDGKCLPQM